MTAGFPAIIPVDCGNTLVNDLYSVILIRAVICLH